MTILSWPDCRNARDLGGLATADGRSIRPGALTRSDNHDRLTPQGIQAIRSSGLSRILDLRWNWEILKYPSPFAGDPLYRNVPLAEGEDEGDSLSDTYRLIVDHSRRSIATAFQALAQAPDGGVLVHCHSGKDRTGILVALALLIAAVPNDTIAVDYARTDGCTPQTMLDTMSHVERQYGGAASYLLDGGATLDDLQAVRSRLLA